MSAATSSSVSLKEYLKRYESCGNDKEKKKKKKKTKDTTGAATKLSSASGVLIVDEDPVWQRPVKLEEDEGNGSDAPGEDEPVVDEDVEVKRLRRLELLRAKKPYLSISEDGSGWVTVDAPLRGTRNDNQSPPRGAGARVSGDEDLSPPRQPGRRRHFTPSPEPEGRGRGWRPRESGDEDKVRGNASAYRDRSPASPIARQTKDEGDLSPRRRVRHDSPDAEASSPDEDLSPPGRNRNARAASTEDMSPPRRHRRSRATATEDMSPPRRKRAASKEDMSPPRRNRTASSQDLSPMKRNRTASMEDMSPPRRSRRSYLEEDLSPPRRSGRGTVSPDRGGRSPSYADLSHPRKNRGVSPERQSRQHRPSEEDLSPPRKNRRVSPERQSRQHRPSEGDLSPPKRCGRVAVSPGRGRSPPDADLSPPRKNRRASPEPESRQHRPSIRKPDEAVDADICPPRRRVIEQAPDKLRSTFADLSPPRKGGDKLSSRGEKKGGLYTGGQIKEEIDRKKAEAMTKYAMMDPGTSGKGAEPVFRDKVTGKRISKEEKLKLEEKAKEKPKEIKLEWGKGLAQKREEEAKAMELELEKERPFARTKDDPELDKMLKERIRWGDPMAHLVKRKDSDIQLKDLGDDEKMRESGFAIPQTITNHSWIKRGIDAPANRYGIRPGRHWDGVDRSTGYEKELFKRQNEKRATQTEAYLWSVSEM